MHSHKAAAIIPSRMIQVGKCSKQYMCAVICAIRPKDPLLWGFFFKLLGCVQHHYQRFDVLVVRYNNYLNILLHFNTLDLFNLVFKFYKENIKSFGSLIGWSLMATSVGSQTIRLGMTGQSWCTLK